LEDAFAGFPPGHAEWWRAQMEVLAVSGRETTKEVLRYLDCDNPLGVDVTRTGISIAGPATIYKVTLDAKRAHPRAIVLCRVGDFYETLGFDAALIVEHAGLNPMGAAPFRAGCPWGSLHATLRKLTDAGWSAAVVEEVGSPRVHGAKPAAKQRVLGGIVSPVAPQYLYGAAEEAAAAEDADAPSAPLLGVAHGARGFSLARVRHDALTFAVDEGLPEAACVAALRAAASHPVFSHASLRLLPGFGASAPLGGGARMTGYSLALALAQHPGGVRPLAASDFVPALCDGVRAELGLPADAAFALAPTELSAGAPRPLALCTALALGVLASPSVPDLISHLLPRDAPALLAATLRAQLLSPPPPDVARSTREALRLLQTLAEPLPHMPLLQGAALARRVRERECSFPFLGQLRALAAAYSRLWATNGEVAAVASALLPASAREAGVVLRGDTLAADCEAVLSLIDAVLPRVADASDAPPPEQRGSLIGSRLHAPEPVHCWPAGDQPPPRPALPPAALVANEEPLRGRVRADLPAVAAAYEALDAASAELDAAVEADLVAHAGAKCRVEYDELNNSVWLALLKGAAPPAALHMPRNRHGRVDDKKLQRWRSTERVDAAMAVYVRAAEEAMDAVREELRAVAQRLEPHLPALVGLAALAVQLRLAAAHCEEAHRRRGWCLPQLLEPGQPWSMEELTPPWMARSEAVGNAFRCDGVLLLTGPNMAGKSTIIRAAGTAALLASCGLHVPAAAARVPLFAALHVRMASSDAPLQRLSHWGLDMVEASAALEAAQLGPRACVMLDELGQGTEIAHATAMAAALLSELDGLGCRAVFATHLHGVLARPAEELPHTRRVRMGTRLDPETGTLRPSMVLEEGESVQSLAFEVARDVGLPERVLQHAARLLEQGPAVAPYPRPHSPPPPPPPRDALRPRSPPPRPAASPGAPAPLRSLDDVGLVLSQVAAAELGFEPQVLQVGLQEMPPPGVTRRCVVYALRLPDGQFYCGQTADLARRLGAHRQAHGRAIEARYVVIPFDKKPRAVEAAAIRRLMDLRVPLVASGDVDNVNF